MWQQRVYLAAASSPAVDLQGVEVCVMPPQSCECEPATLREGCGAALAMAPLSLDDPAEYSGLSASDSTQQLLCASPYDCKQTNAEEDADRWHRQAAVAAAPRLNTDWFAERRL